jgi:hypothetical protein
MKKINLLLIGLALLCGGSALADDVAVPRSCEYWLDYQFDARQRVDIGNDWATQLDIDALAPGLHVLGLRVEDSRGRWGYAMLRHFYKLPVHPDLSGNAVASCEYWVDYDFANRSEANVNDNMIELSLPTDQLAGGLHTLALLMKDSNGQPSYTMVRHFLVIAQPKDLTANTAKTFEYWIDYDHAARETASIVDGQVTLNIDVHALSSGVHTLHYQSIDGQGQRSPITVRHFVIPQEVKKATGMVAYEYWFNHGPRVHVDVDPQNPLELTEVMIEVKDVWPNAIRDDYRLDVNSGTVYTDDDVFFGIQALDDLGHATQAVLSETFAMTVPVYPQWTQLADNTPAEAMAPEVSHITGFKMPTADGDLLCWKVEGTEGQIRLNSADGSHLDGEMFSFEGGVGCAAVATSKQTYALLYDATRPNESINVKCTRTVLGDVNADKVIDVADIATVIDYLAGRHSVALLMADVNSDGVVDVADIAAIIDTMAGK